MRRFLSTLTIGVCLYAFPGCASDPSTDEATTDTFTIADKSPEIKPATNYPYEATYASDWKVGDPELIVKVMNMYKAVEDNHIDSIRPLLADTIYYRTYDNRIIQGKPDDFIKLLKAHRSKFTDYKEEMQTFVSLHSEEKNTDWVPVWVVETVTRRNGKKDTTSYQESFRFTHGKITRAEGYARYAPGK